MIAVSQFEHVPVAEALERHFTSTDPQGEFEALQNAVDKLVSVVCVMAEDYVGEDVDKLNKILGWARFSHLETNGERDSV